MKTCSICTDSPICFGMFSECVHVFCHICTLRLFFFYKQKECPLCKVKSSSILIFKEQKSFSVYDTNLKIYFDGNETKNWIKQHFKEICPVKECPFFWSPWINKKANEILLEQHLKKKHMSLKLCMICINANNLFPFEYKTYKNDEELRKHKEIDHFICELCKEFFYSKEELLLHIKTKYERCHLCSHKVIYFKFHSDLDKHFKEKHFPCPYKECKEQRFFIFETKTELDAHVFHTHNKKRIPILLGTNQKTQGPIRNVLPPIETIYKKDPKKEKKLSFKNILIPSTEKKQTKKESKNKGSWKRIDFNSL